MDYLWYNRFLSSHTLYVLIKKDIERLTAQLTLWKQQNPECPATNAAQLLMQASTRALMSSHTLVFYQHSCNILPDNNKHYWQ